MTINQLTKIYCLDRIQYYLIWIIFCVISLLIGALGTYQTFKSSKHLTK